ncbi:FixH family protein [Campylobacter taeniopygiae]|uniref:FixH family protein n=1 Tax=Campylobacter taeniopygiae TaxID=2510188 RepID=UPI003D6B658F
MDKKKTFWPYGLLIAFLLIIGASVVTVVISSDYPVYEDDFYFDSYQNVENNYNEIQKQQDNFNKLFKVDFENKDLQLLGARKIPVYTIDSNSYVANFKIESLGKADVQNLKYEILLTRPHTKKDDQKLQGQIKQGILSISFPSKIEEGRWQLKFKLVENPQTIGFFSYELYVK